MKLGSWKLTYYAAGVGKRGVRESECSSRVCLNFFIILLLRPFLTLRVNGAQLINLPSTCVCFVLKTKIIASKVSPTFGNWNSYEMKVEGRRRLTLVIRQPD